MATQGEKQVNGLPTLQVQVGVPVAFKIVGAPHEGSRPNGKGTYYRMKVEHEGQEKFVYLARLVFEVLREKAEVGLSLNLLKDEVDADEQGAKATTYTLTFPQEIVKVTPITEEIRVIAKTLYKSPEALRAEVEALYGPDPNGKPALGAPLPPAPAPMPEPASTTPRPNWRSEEAHVQRAEELTRLADGQPWGARLLEYASLYRAATVAAMDVWADSPLAINPDKVVATATTLFIQVATSLQGRRRGARERHRNIFLRKSGRSSCGEAGREQVY